MVVAAAVLVAAAGFAAGLAAAFGAAAAGFAAADVFFASLTGPEGPFGLRKSPSVSPDLRALLIWAFNAASVVAPRLLLAWMYLVIAWRL